MTVVAFLDPEHADKWLKGMNELGYVVTEKVSTNPAMRSTSGGTVLVLDKPAATIARGADRGR